MKKILLLAAFSAPGLVSANTIYEEMNSFEYQVAEDARFDFSIVESDHLDYGRNLVRKSILLGW